MRTLEQLMLAHLLSATEFTVLHDASLIRDWDHVWSYAAWLSRGHLVLRDEDEEGERVEVKA